MPVYIDSTKPLQNAYISFYISVSQYAVCKPIVSFEINIVGHEEHLEKKKLNSNYKIAECITHGKVK